MFFSDFYETLLYIGILYFCPQLSLSSIIIVRASPSQLAIHRQWQIHWRTLLF